MIPSPGERFANWWANAGYEQTGYDDVFYHDVPPELAAEARRRERNESSKGLQQPWPLEAWPDTPTRYLLCRDDRMFPAAWARRHARERLGLDPDEMDDRPEPTPRHRRPDPTRRAPARRTWSTSSGRAHDAARGPEGFIR
jgi:hypothetical protein